MGWLSTTSKDLVVVSDGRQGFMQLNATGGGPNVAGEVYQDGSYSNYANNGYGRNELAYACFDRDAAISLVDGTLRSIAEIQIGDVVCSHKGKPRRVLGVSGRAHTGELLTIRRASASRRLIVTPEHPFFVGRGTRTGEIAYDWVDAGDLRTNTHGANSPDGDWLVEPVPDDAQDLTEYTVTRPARGPGKRSNRHWTTWTVQVDAGLLRLVGYFLAEGFCNQRAVKFAFHEDEHDYHGDVTKLMAEHFGARLSQYPYIANGRATVLTFHSTRAVEFFVQFGRGARDKRVPAWVLVLPPDKQRHVIDGAWRGDGSAGSDRYTLTSAGRNLIEGYRLILLRLGICARLTTTTRLTTPPAGLPREATLHQLSMTGDQMRRFADVLGLPHRGPEPRRPRVSAFIRNGYAHWRVLEVERREVADYPVYNLEVEADNSYIVDGVAAHNCIRYRAESLPQATIRVYQSDDATEIPEHPLRQLFAKPNPVTNEFEFFELSSTYKDLAGTCFWLCVKGRNGQPAELWPLRPDLLSALPNPRNLADYTWIYRPDPERPEIAVPVPPAGTKAAAAQQAFIIRVRYPNPNPRDLGWRYFGMPPMRPAARAVTLDNGATDFVDKLLRNHAMPSVVIETEQEITPKVHERLETMWRNAFGGARRTTPAFLQKGMKLHELGLSLTNLEFPDLREVSETRVCMAFAVEPILVGAKTGLVHNAYKDYREARLSFWEETMFTEERRYIEPVRKDLVPLFAGAGRRSVKVRWDNSEVLALKEATGALWERSTGAFRAGGITQNDFRRYVGLPPVPNGDMFLIPAGVTPTPIDAVPAAASPTDAAAAAQAVQEAGSVAASLGILAAEYGIELTRDELAMVAARAGLER